ncbi:hypothetical protein A7K93_03350 [Candidatus Methylacidiphilum fumarolicum]|nr:hypothetical protein A7K73_06680 [Candidatus Methylacidiphilum fumarolicum]TFE72767.1 hypothetical protein A7K72_07545 [Candidatus Methylacidiphilum fumarolicum]TFE74696.1 hypothetical protein A7K93_03350 [Candidatus Methylacidiphilum fumarolicum]TFE77753.1 hypothetical protein A7D33_03380 [Candidatus Methylacidiphilum fumarolicum]
MICWRNLLYKKLVSNLNFLSFFPLFFFKFRLASFPFSLSLWRHSLPYAFWNIVFLQSVSFFLKTLKT